jgi:hypothetical protein
MRLMGALERLQEIVIAAAEAGRQRQLLEIIGPERDRLIGQREQSERVRPGAPLNGPPAALERVRFLWDCGYRSSSGHDRSSAFSPRPGALS